MGMNTEMGVKQALETILDAASRWAENDEENYPARLTAEMGDAEIEQMLDGVADYDETDIEQAKFTRNVWRAVQTVNMLLEQRGCEHFDPAVRDGALTTLCDVVIYG